MIIPWLVFIATLLAVFLLERRLKYLNDHYDSGPVA